MTGMVRRGSLTSAVMPIHNGADKVDYSWNKQTSLTLEVLRVRGGRVTNKTAAYLFHNQLFVPGRCGFMRRPLFNPLVFQNDADGLAQ